jgi:hypothetical protein
MYDGQEWCRHIILMVNLKARDHYEDQSGDERIIEIWVFKK